MSFPKKRLQVPLAASSAVETKLHERKVRENAASEKPSSLHQRESKALSHLLETLAKQLGECMFVADSRAVVRTVWAGSGTGAKKQPNQFVKYVSGVLRRPELAPLANVFRRVLKTRRSACIERKIHLHRHPRWFLLQVMPGSHSLAGPKAVRCLALDVSDCKHAEEKLRKSENLLTQAERLARMGSYEVDLKSGRLFWSDQIYRNLGLNPHSAPHDLNSFFQMIHPDDRCRIEKEVAQAVAQSQILDSEFRVVLPNGEVRTLHRRAFPFYDEEGRPSGIAGISQDVTERRQSEQRLRQSETLLAQAEETAKFGSWQIEIMTGKASFSRQAMRMLGLRSESDWNRDRFWENILAKDRDRVRKSLRQAMADAKPFEFSSFFRMPDNSRRLYHFHCLPVVEENGAIEFVRGVMHDITEQSRHEEDLHRISQRLLRIQDVERRNLARELHETAGQSLAALKMTLASIEDAIADSPGSLPELFRSARGLAEDAVREVRLVSHLMHPPELDAMGLGPALRSYVIGFSSRSGIKTSVDIAENIGRHPPDVELSIFRIVQEALTNVHRYSGSPTASIRLTSNDEEIQVEICDCGCGLPPPSGPANKSSHLGVGIAGMRERIQQLNGRFEIESTAGRGTIVRAAYRF